MTTIARPIRTVFFSIEILLGGGTENSHARLMLKEQLHNVGHANQPIQVCVVIKQPYSMHFRLVHKPN
jgi:hypothetical protein